ncbi:MAG: hypothetical protein Q7R40_11510 [Phaeospirillum sp.]|nr:hypothetical protein [Phaeospirillum sp.]
MTPTEKKPLKFLAKHLFFGVVAAITFGVLVLATDLGHIRTLLQDSDNPYPVLGLMFFGLIITFGGVAMAAGIMSLSDGKDED